jgi:hypothetical protein
LLELPPELLLELPPELLLVLLLEGLAEPPPDEAGDAVGVPDPPDPAPAPPSLPPPAAGAGFALSAAPAVRWSFLPSLP